MGDLLMIWNPVLVKYDERDGSLRIFLTGETGLFGHLLYVIHATTETHTQPERYIRIYESNLKGLK